MQIFLIKAAQLVVALSLLVIIHEFGHYIIARAFGIRVEKFYLFFNPWFSLYKWKPRPKASNPEGKASWRDTEYGIGWLPLGGYVKIAGMIDESMDTEQLKQEPQPWEFRTKAAWQRLLVMLGGVIFNFVLAIIIYAGIAWYWGDRYIPVENAYEGMDFVPEAQAVGFRNGDIPLEADGRVLDSSRQDYLLTLAQAHEVKVLRNHRDTVAITLPENFLLTLNEAGGFMNMRVPVFIERTVPGEPAARAGLLPGDRIIAIDTVETPSYTELTPALAAFGGKETTICIDRGGLLLTLPITPTEGGKLGFQLRDPRDIFESVEVHYSILGSIPKGIELGTNMLTNYVGSMKYVFTKEGAKSLGGFGAIGNMFPERWNWYLFWEMTAFLSVALAFMNIIPIPGLDGGHVAFLLYEVVTRRRPPEKVLIYAQYAGMAFLLALLLYANGNDLLRAFIK